MGSPVLADAHGADDGQHGIHDPDQNAEEDGHFSSHQEECRSYNHHDR